MLTLPFAGESREPQSTATRVNATAKFESEQPYHEGKT